MPEVELHAWAVRTELAFALAAFIALVWIRAPYGRHARAGWGPDLPPRLAWSLMESPASLGFLLILMQGRHRTAPAVLVLAVFWLAHYLNRTFVYPLRIPLSSRRVPALVVAMGFGFNVLNAYVNARWISHLGSYSVEWLTDPRFGLGALLFALGVVINLRADATLRALRRTGTGYRVPHGGLFRFVSCPNYLGEIIEWAGWAVMTWSTAGLAFAVFTAANLAPRALSHHRWYHDRFPDYPRDRKALVPFVV